MDPFLAAALREARSGQTEGGIPIGSVLVHDGEIIARGRNRRLQRGSVIRHAEMDCLENAGPMSAKTYRQCTLYTTLSPCDMCSGAVLFLGIPRVIVGENSTYRGPEDYLRSRGIKLHVLDESICIELMKAFLHKHPDIWNESIRD